MAVRGWSQFMGHCRVHSQDQDHVLYVYYPTHRWARFLPDPLAEMLTALTKALLSMDRCQIFLGGRAQARVNLFSHSADITLPPVCIFISALTMLYYQYH